ncbi:MAG: hypothetical protein MPJ24_05420, partial [Pirellulaceae bacterium]|nr:hypothetical protein [Pirellulaceae bacterium]
MPNYRKLGVLPPKRHIELKRPKEESFLGEGLFYEHVVTTEGFARAYSILYHAKPPTRVQKVEFERKAPLEKAEDLPLRHFHLKSQDLPHAGDPITGRVPFMFNNDMEVWR